MLAKITFHDALHQNHRCISLYWQPQLYKICNSNTATTTASYIMNKFTQHNMHLAFLRHTSRSAYKVADVSWTRGSNEIFAWRSWRNFRHSISAAKAASWLINMQNLPHSGKQCFLNRCGVRSKLYGCGHQAALIEWNRMRICAWHRTLEYRKVQNIGSLSQEYGTQGWCTLCAHLWIFAGTRAHNYMECSPVCDMDIGRWVEREQNFAWENWISCGHRIVSATHYAFGATGRWSRRWVSNISGFPSYFIKWTIMAAAGKGVCSAWLFKFLCTSTTTNYHERS